METHFGGNFTELPRPLIRTHALLLLANLVVHAEIRLAKIRVGRGFLQKAFGEIKDIFRCM